MQSPFTIKEINLLSSSIHNLPANNDCTICRCNLNIPSLYNQEKYKKSDIIIGKCQHSFHSECIHPWLNINKHCPICSQKFVIYKKLE